jgi:hypothetical protein
MNTISLLRLRINCIKIHESEFLYLTNCARTKGPQEPNNRGFSGFFNEKGQKNLQGNRLLC